jgi:hypothetical protein
MEILFEILATAKGGLAGEGGRDGKGDAYMITPDMTPWSYPKRKTPNDTKMEVK